MMERVHPKVGDLVKFIGCTQEQANWGACDYPQDLRIDEFYVIEDVEVHTWHTRIKVENHSGHFNSVCFV